MSVRWWAQKRLPERRGAARIRGADLVVYFWTGAVPAPRRVRNIGLRGAYVEAPEVFYPGTLIQMVFVDRAKSDETQSNICVCAKIWRKGKDGFAVVFLFADMSERRRLRRFLNALTPESATVTVTGAESTHAGVSERAALAPEAGEQGGAGAHQRDGDDSCADVLFSNAQHPASAWQREDEDEERNGA